MQHSIILYFLLSFSLAGYAATQNTTPVGGGPYPAGYFVEPTLANHTIYMPMKSPQDLKLPALVWSEGGCDANGTGDINFLTNIASYRFIVVANGLPNGSETLEEDPSWTKASVDWLSNEAPNIDNYKNVKNVDISKIAAAGHSCGGLETYTLRNDTRVKYLGIFSSGFLPAHSGLPANIVAEPPSTISQVHKPVFYFVGGTTDVAYPYAEEDYHNLTSVPKWIGNYAVGHEETFSEPNGGAFGLAAVNWLLWIFKESESSAAFFTAGGADRTGWTGIEHFDLENLLSFYWKQNF